MKLFSRVNKINREVFLDSQPSWFREVMNEQSDGRGERGHRTRQMKALKRGYETSLKNLEKI